MQMSDTNKQGNQSLTDKITELESLLSNTNVEAETIPVLNEMAGPGNISETEIPILDELVHAEDADDRPQQTELPAATSGQLLDLINNIEHRLTDELETLVSTLKYSMKESIIDELKNRLETTSHGYDKPGNNKVTG